MRIEEYQDLCTIIEDNIKKQETTSNLIITILGFSSLSSMPNKDNLLLSITNNIYFLLTILFTTTVLLSRIVHCRNSIYRIMTYLQIESDNIWDENAQKATFLWKRHEAQFKAFQFGKQASTKDNIISTFTLGFPFILKNVGYLGLSVLLGTKVHSLIKTSDIVIHKNVIAGIVIILTFINFFLTLLIICDRFIVPKRYYTIWNKVLSKNREVSHPSGKNDKNEQSLMPLVLLCGIILASVLFEYYVL